MTFHLSAIDQAFYLAGVKIDNLSLQESLDYIEKILKGQKSHYIVTPNAAHIVLLQRDKDFKKAYKKASLALPDGMSLVWASRLMKARLKERIAGVDLIFSLCNIAVRKKHLIFLLGTRKETIGKAKNILQQQFPGLQIIGTQNGYFKNNQKVIEKINMHQPDILFIGMGFPKQEKWIYKNISQLNVKVAVTIGGAFDLIAGKVKRAPIWMQNWGLEWLWRLIREPRRLWKRYIIGNTIFIWIVLKEFFKKKHGVDNKFF